MSVAEVLGLVGLAAGGVSGAVGLAAGGVSGAVGLALVYFELVRWWRLRRGRRRLLAIAARERAAAARLSPWPYGRRVVSLDAERARRRCERSVAGGS